MNIQKKTIKIALWKKKNNKDVMIEGQHKIARSRLHGPIRVGGLNMRSTKEKAECLYLDSGIRHFQRYCDGEAPRLVEISPGIIEQGPAQRECYS